MKATSILTIGVGSASLCELSCARTLPRRRFGHVHRLGPASGADTARKALDPPGLVLENECVANVMIVRVAGLSGGATNSAATSSSSLREAAVGEDHDDAAHGEHHAVVKSVEGSSPGRNSRMWCSSRSRLRPSRALGISHRARASSA